MRQKLFIWVLLVAFIFFSMVTYGQSSKQTKCPKKKSFWKHVDLKGEAKLPKLPAINLPKLPSVNFPEVSLPKLSKINMPKLNLKSNPRENVAVNTWTREPNKKSSTKCPH